MRIVVATGNAHKIEEIGAILSPLVPGIELTGYTGDSPVENGVTFSENALIKARAAAFATGLPAIADDSGIAVDVMGGSPGILSARWAGPGRSDLENLELLLWQMSDIPAEHRQAAFVCAAALVMPDGAETVCEKRWEGSILQDASGANGFGYDPIFKPNGYDVAAAELDATVKNSISHRFLAFSALAVKIQE